MVACAQMSELHSALLAAQVEVQGQARALRETEIKLRNVEQAKVVLEMNLQETGGQLMEVERELISSRHSRQPSSSSEDEVCR